MDRSLFRPVLESGILNPGYACLQNPRSGKFLLVESGIRGFSNPESRLQREPETKFH